MKNNNVTVYLNELSAELNEKITTLLNIDNSGGLTAELDAAELLSSRLEQLKNIVDNIPFI